MGAGKTTFTKGLALGLNITDTIVSPTFTLMNSYLGRLSLYHYDMFRIENKEEIAELGIEEYLGQSDGVSVVEWNKFDLRGFKVIRINIENTGENTRRITVN
jgi:tRNA threonylcarbamoyladenosine biosynthesis protein TsaE